MIDALFAIVRRWTTRSPRNWDWRNLSKASVIPAREVLVMMVGGIGDAIMGLPVVWLLRERFPGVTVRVLAGPATAELLRGHPGIDEVLVLPTQPDVLGLLKAVWHLRRTSFDAVVGIRPSSLQSTALLVRLLRVGRAVKHRRDYDSLRTDWQIWFTDLVAEDPQRHNLQCNIDLLGPLGVDARDTEETLLARWSRIYLPKEQRAWAHARYPKPVDRPRIGLHPGCRADWAFKRWETAKFIDLAERLHREKGAQIFILGGPDEREFAQQLSESMRCPHTNLIGMLKLRETAAVIADCDVFVSNDSGLMHLATAVEVPTVGVFSASHPRNDPGRTGPFGKAHRIVSGDPLAEIPVEKVYAQAIALLGTKLDQDDG